MKGKIKETAGHVSNNPDLESKGQVENLGGRIQNEAAQVEKTFEK